MESEFDDVWELAKAKIAEEETTLWLNDIGLAGIIYHSFNRQTIGAIDASRVTQTRMALRGFAAKYCTDDAARRSKGDVEDAGRILDRAVSVSVRRMNTGLSSWISQENHTSEIFAANYVDSIVVRYGNQARAIHSAGLFLDASIHIVEKSRSTVLDLLRQLREGLEVYDPTLLLNILIGRFAMFGAGFVVGPVTAAVMSAADFLLAESVKELSGSSGTGVAGMFEAFRTALEVSGVQRDDAYVDLGSQIDQLRLGQSPKDHICSRPSAFDADGE